MFLEGDRIIFCRAKTICAVRKGASKTNTLNFDAIPTPIRAPEIMEYFLSPVFITLYKKYKAHIEKKVMNVSKVKK